MMGGGKKKSSFQPATSDGHLLNKWHKYRKTRDKKKTYHKKQKYDLGCPSPIPRLALLHTHSLCAGRQQEILGFEAARGELVLGL